MQIGKCSLIAGKAGFIVTVTDIAYLCVSQPCKVSDCITGYPAAVTKHLIDLIVSRISVYGNYILFPDL